jgi:hypothetical protein
VEREDINSLHGASTTRSGPDSPNVREGNRMVLSGIIIGPIGDAMTLIGPALMVAGARLKPVVLDEP